jgi:hypothetical protein
MTDQTKYDIDFLNAQNKYRTYQEKKKATEQIKELLKKHSSDTLIDMIMKESEVNNDYKLWQEKTYWYDLKPNDDNGMSLKYLWYEIILMMK